MKIAQIMACGTLVMSLAGGLERLSGIEIDSLQNYALRTWGKSEGLSESSVAAIVQTRDAYLWIGTGAGLYRFDGIRFVEFPLRGPGITVPGSITALTEDAAGRLWIGTEQRGLFCRLANGAVQHYGIADGLLGESVTSLAIDAEDALWIGTPQGVNRRDARGFTAFQARHGLPDGFVSHVHAARSGAVWITTRRGMCSITKGHLAPFEFQLPGQGRHPDFLGAYEDRRGNLWAFGTTYLINVTAGKRFNYFHEEQPASMRIWSLCEGRDGRLWIGTSGGGLFCFDGDKFNPVTFRASRWLNDVRAICEDREGNLWLGVSGKGLTRLQRQTVTTFKEDQGLPGGAATCLTLDFLGRVNLGREWGGVYVHLGQHFERLSDPSGMTAHDSVSGLCSGPEGSLWVGTAGSGLCQIMNGRTAHFTTANGLTENGVFSMCRGTDGAIWAGTRAGTLHRLEQNKLTTYTDADGLPGTPIRVLLSDSDEGVWIGTEDGILLQARNDSFSRAKTGPEVTHNAILSLYKDAAGRLWVGTAGDGLGCLSGDKYLAWDVRSGLPDDVVSGIVDDTQGTLWLVTAKGIYRIDARSITEAIVNSSSLKSKLVFATSEGGVRGPVLGGVRALRSAENRLWFATDAGPVAIDARDWQTELPPPPVHIEAVLVNNERLSLLSAGHASVNTAPRARQDLPANLRSLEIQFTALSFTAPERLVFRHKLEGFDTDWVETGSERHVRYGRLPSGRYQFRVTARNADGGWNEDGATYAFLVPTPLWRTPWALATYGLAVTGSMIGVVRLVSHRRLRHRLARAEQQKAMERERVRIAQDMHDEIGSKLTKISFLSELAKVEMGNGGTVAGKIDSIAHTSRELLQSLDEIVWAVNPRNDTLEHLAAYLAQYATEYFQDTSVECDLRLPGELPQQPMSAEVRHNVFLAFEESLNNALKHSGATHVSVQIKTSLSRFEIHVTDNGKGFQPPPQDAGPSVGPGGNGLLNMRQRLSDTGGQCEIESAPGQGTTIRLSVPLLSSKHNFT